ncbi:MAG: ferrous iron transporter B [Kiritimatiellae bacterium]|nr:ferrous iron transporter B [Kiritimatiellia bacterium]
MAIKIALAGNPNCGKTTLFNDLTGSSQYVGNWPGVTVEKKEGVLKGRKDVVVQDLPGIYSLSPYSLEEVIARNYLVNDRPDAILNIVDGTNLERNLYLTTQLLELGIPTVVAVNMIDAVRKSGDKIDAEKLSKKLGCPVVEISALNGEGTKEAAESAVKAAQEGVKGERPHVFTGSVEHAIAHIEESLQGKVNAASIRWAAIKVFERDAKAIAALNVPADVISHVEGHVADCEKEMDDDAESIITAQRYAYIKEVAKAASTRGSRNASTSLSDKIDRFVTHRILALPLFILSLCAMWWLAVAEKGPGTILTDWANDGFLGDGWHLPFTTHECTVEGKYKGMEFEDAQCEFAKQDASKSKWEEAYLEKVNEGKADGKKLEEMPEKIDEAVAKTVVAKDVFVEDEETGEPVAKECDCEKCSKKREAGEECDGCGCGCGEPDKWDVDYAAYQQAKEWEEPDPSQFGVWVPGIGALLGDGMDKMGVSDMVKSLVVDGAWGGVATVLGFVPVIFIVFLFLSFLEDCGYMARVAFIMDRIFRKFGLSGKSFIPMIVGKGCGVPAVMAARTIESERDRRMTIILSTFIPCGAKTVIIAMFAALFFREMWYVAPLMDVIGIAIIVLGGIALKKSRFFAGEAAPFVMELPAYHLPTFGGVLRHTWNRVKAYMLKAGLIIFPACVFLWLIMHFDFRFNLLEDEQIADSMLATMGGWIAWLFAPLGFGTWQGAAASVSAEIAKEQATATLGLVAANMDGVTTGAHIINLFKSMSAFPKLAAMSFMLFNLFVPPCMVAIAVTFREMGSAKWGWLAIAFQLFVGYTLALSVYQIGMLVAGGAFGVWTVVAILVDLWCFWMIVRPARKTMENGK